MNRIEDKELEQIREQQTKLAQIKQDLGTLEVRKHEVMQVFLSVNKEVEETKSELEKKYGRVNINLDDGTYSQIEEEVVE
jgi:vacuolar-type H+-ATPase subunit D/Vma8